mgnify:FL=1|tara:strand:- start:159 stop:836 length:678 start_codon:yes stop_codon:yes gene_type:complete
MLFRKNKPIDIYYDFDTSLFTNFTPKGFFNNVEEYSIEKKINCPGNTVVNKQLYLVRPPADITYKLDKLNYEFEYKGITGTDTNTQAIHNLTELNVNNGGVYSFQFLVPYIFYTDSPDTHITLLPPDIHTENVKFVTGTFNINQWLRSAISAYVIVDPEKPAVIEYKKDKPIYYVMFNKNANVNYKLMKPETYDYFLNIREVNRYRAYVNKYAPGIISRKPKSYI